MLVWLVKRFEPSADLPSEVISVTILIVLHAFGLCFLLLLLFPSKVISVTILIVLHAFSVCFLLLLLFPSEWVSVTVLLVLHAFVVCFLLFLLFPSVVITATMLLVFFHQRCRTITKFPILCFCCFLQLQKLISIRPGGHWAGPGDSDSHCCSVHGNQG